MATPFFLKIYKVVGRIPKGKVLTYGDVARLVGSSGASRAVGTAMKLNPNLVVCPCHRVVGSDGKMHGYANGGESVKMQILKGEGVKFEGDRVDLSLSRWE